jgi:hypothetical protein
LSNPLLSPTHGGIVIQTPCESPILWSFHVKNFMEGFRGRTPLFVIVCVEAYAICPYVLALPISGRISRKETSLNDHMGLTTWRRWGILCKFVSGDCDKIMKNIEMNAV